MEGYNSFIQKKEHFYDDSGFDPIWMPDFLYPFQSDFCGWAIRKGRGAIFADCGLGKTAQYLTWAENVVRKNNGNVLILTPLAVSDQVVSEGEKFGIEVEKSRDGKFNKKIIVTNYERLKHFDSDDFVACVADEASIIKNFKSQTKGAVTQFMKRMSYRLLATATAAPNDYIELGTSSEALGYLGYMDMLNRFFKNEQGNSSVGRYMGETIKWRLKHHAETKFWQWVTSWARACRKPSDLGHDDGDFILPELTEEQHEVKATRPHPGKLFVEEAHGLKEQREELRMTLTERCEKVAELIQGRDVSVHWANLNAEADLLEKLIPGAVQVSGSMPEEQKEERIKAFASGEIKHFVTKPKITGFGMNWQHCNYMSVFPSHCYDETTEILTDRGWMLFGDVKHIYNIATINPNTLFFEWQKPTAIVWSKYSGDMIHFRSNAKTNRSFDLLVTPNHRMFVKRCPIRYAANSCEWKILTAGYLENNFKRQEYRMMSVPKGFNGKKLSHINIPPLPKIDRVSYKKTNKNGDKRGLSPISWRNLDMCNTIEIKTIDTDIFMQLAGWYLSEGSCGFRDGYIDGQIRITQTDANIIYRDEILNMFKSIKGLNIYDKTKDIRACSRQLASYLVNQFGHGSYEKRIPNWVKNLSPDYLSILRDTMLKGDGCSLVKGGYKRSYRTVSKQLADDFVEISIKTGVRASAQYRLFNTGIYAGSGIWEVNLAWNNIEPSICCKPKKISYSGMIGCVSVPNGTVVVRRNGIPVVSGNSFEQYYQMVRRLWRFGQKRDVHVDLITTPGLRKVLSNLQRKQADADKMFTELVRLMNDSINIDRNRNEGKKITLPNFLNGGKKWEL